MRDYRVSYVNTQGHPRAVTISESSAFNAYMAVYDDARKFTHVLVTDLDSYKEFDYYVR